MSSGKRAQLESYHLGAPVQLEVKAHDGTTLYATLLLPEEHESGQRAAHRESVRRARVPDVANRWGE